MEVILQFINIANFLLTAKNDGFSCSSIGNCESASCAAASMDAADDKALVATIRPGPRAITDSMVARFQNTVIL